MMDIAEQEIVTVSRNEARSMKAAVRSADADAKVTMTATQFTHLASMIEALCDLVPEPGSFNDQRHWVPLAQFEILRQNVLRLEAAFHQSGEKTSLNIVGGSGPVTLN